MNVPKLTLTTISGQIMFIRGHKVMLDSDLATLYGVETKMLKRAVRRNIERFPDDFMFELTQEEFANLRYQFGTSSESEAEKPEGHGGTRYMPFAFTEQGVAMLSGILNSERAIQVNIAIMRTFVKIRMLISTNKELSDKINDMESKYDKQFKIVYDMLKMLIEPGDKPKKAKLGFRTDKETD